MPSPTSEKTPLAALCDSPEQQSSLRPPPQQQPPQQPRTGLVMIRRTRFKSFRTSDALSSGITSHKRSDDYKPQPETTRPDKTAPLADETTRNSISKESSELSFYIRSHKRSIEYEFQFEIMQQPGQMVSWVDETTLLQASPDTVYQYWEGLPGKRDKACDNLWKIWKIWDENKEWRKYKVSWVGSKEHRWMTYNYVRKYAPNVIEEWKASKEYESSSRGRAGKKTKRGSTQVAKGDRRSRRRSARNRFGKIVRDGS